MQPEAPSPSDQHPNLDHTDQPTNTAVDTATEHQSNHQTRAKTPWLRIVWYVSIVIAISAVFWQQQNIRDWWELRNYTPSSAVASLSSDATMTDSAKRIFYVQNPQIQDKNAFYTSCEGGEAAIVLGCYKPTSGIFILKVDNPKLNGVEQVTAAHEMLHAAYQRLSSSQKKRLQSQLNEAYAQVTDKIIRDKILAYQKDGADVTNELHSILGTEVQNLPQSLESYYQRYFTNRAAVVAFAQSYQNEFASRKAKIAELDSTLASLEETIKTKNNELLAEKATLQAESNRLDALLKSGDITAYNIGVAAYNQSLIPFRAKIRETNKLVSDYKTILSQRNNIAVEVQELDKALDSRITTTVEGI